MLHKISDLCKKIDVIKKKSDELYEMKYGKTKHRKSEINNLIQDIQHLCYVVANDKQEYKK